MKFTCSVFHPFDLPFFLFSFTLYSSIDGKFTRFDLMDFIHTFTSISFWVLCNAHISHVYWMWTRSSVSSNVVQLEKCIHSFNPKKDVLCRCIIIGRCIFGFEHLILLHKSIWVRFVLLLEIETQFGGSLKLFRNAE